MVALLHDTNWKKDKKKKLTKNESIPLPSGDL